MLVELNVDALVGPTHHFGGVGVGNVASAVHQHLPSSPRRAALEGLRKAELVASLGVPQFVLPPLERPLTDWFAHIGLAGDFQQQCRLAREQVPQAYSTAFSSAFMWAANAATFAPAVDCRDGQHHLTLANLSSSWHRFSESRDRQKQFEQMFAALDSLPGYCIHSALPPVMPLRDEGAANHMRLCDSSGQHGFHVFVYGSRAGCVTGSTRFETRQTLEACQAIARLHQLEPSRTFYLQQHPQAIDAGVFHNDVIATSHRQLLLIHEQAFLDGWPELQRLAGQFERVTGTELTIIQIPAHEVSLAEAVSSYLFNSQLLTPQADPAAMVLVCAEQCRQSHRVARWIERLIADPSNPISEVHYVSLDESMAGGGGPACLRLRLTLPPDQAAMFAQKWRLTPLLARRLEELIQTHYPERLEWSSLANAEHLSQYQAAYQAFQQL